MSKHILKNPPWNKISTAQLIAKPKKKPIAPEEKQKPATDNRLKPHAAMATGKYIPFWLRNHYALREVETRLTYKDDPASAAKLARARDQIAQQKPARNLLLAAVKKRQAA